MRLTLTIHAVHDAAKVYDAVNETLHALAIDGMLDDADHEPRTGWTWQELGRSVRAQVPTPRAFGARVGREFRRREGRR